MTCQEKIFLNARQLREALDFANPDKLTGDEEEETLVCIEYLPERISVEGELMPAGYYLWFDACPEEGVIGPLGEEVDEENDQ